MLEFISFILVALGWAYLVTLVSRGFNKLFEGIENEKDNFKPFIRCYLGACGGLPITKHNDAGELWCAWKCQECGAIKHAHKVD